MEKLKELQATAAQLDTSLQLTRTQIDRVIGALELLAEMQARVAQVENREVKVGG